MRPQMFTDYLCGLAVSEITHFSRELCWSFLHAYTVQGTIALCLYILVTPCMSGNSRSVYHTSKCDGHSTVISLD